MKSYVKLFAPVTLAIFIGSLTFVFGQTTKDENRPAPRGERPGFGKMPPPGFGPRGADPRFMQELGLTDEQDAEIKKLHDDAFAASRVYFEKLQVINEKIGDLTEPETFDENEARALIKQRNDLQTEIDIIRLRTQAAVNNLLSAEQIAKLATLKNRRPEFPPRDGFRPLPPDQR